ncbi:membrane protein, partial [Fusobacterium necrophorum BFTR-2]
KSPWASWQFGINYVYENGGSRFKGRGDKDNLYYYNKVFTRGNWKEKNALDSIEGKKPNGHPITPGSDSQHSWKNIDNSSSGGITIDKDTSIGSSTNGNRSWGLVDLRDLKEPTNEVEVLARIFPKEVTKQAISLNITEPTVQTLEAPDVNPQVNEPLSAPVIELPEVETVTINPLIINAPSAPTAPSAPVINIGITAPNAPVPPTISVQPTNPSVPTAPNINISVTTPNITPLSITAPGNVDAPNVVSPEIKPVDFTVDPGGDSLVYTSDKDDEYGSKHQGWKSNWPKEINVTELTSRNYVSLTRDEANSTIPTDQVINVTAENNRAMVVDEVNKDGITVNFQGTIHLQRKKNVGIDLQGTHTGSKTAPSIANIINSGKIIGEAKHNNIVNENQIAFGFNNADASRNTTMTHMINEGTIELNAPSSAGIQLKPEDPHYWQPDNWAAAPLQITKKATDKKMGRVLMKADNKKDINLKSKNSFGILTVFNEGVPKSLFASSYQSNHETLRKERTYDGERVLPGGEIGRSALEDSKYTSGIYNTGTITISGDNSIGIGLLQEIQEVKVDGNINVGKEDPNQEDEVSNLTGKERNKVENAVGVFAGVPTKPVKAGEKDTLIDNDGSRNQANSLVGTETVELGGNITLGKFASSSIGVLVGDTEVKLDEGKENGNTISDRKYKRSGDITAKASSTIIVGGMKNYGFVINNSAHSSTFGSEVDDLIYFQKKNEHGRGKNAGTIDVTGKESVGFALIKGGHSENSGKILVSGNATDSIGFYGEEDQFTNQVSGEINVTSAGEKNKGVVLNGKNAEVHFINAGKIITGNSVKGKEKVGVYAQGKYKFEHNTGANMEVGSNNIGFYVKDNTGTVTIKAPIVLSKSDGGTSIGVYSDGEAKVNFGENSKLEIGEGAVGLYSADPTKFNNTFKIETGKTLDVELGKNSTFGLLNGNKSTTASPLLSKYLNNGTADKINITSFGEGASLFYATLKAKAILDEDYEVTNGQSTSTAVLVANDGANVEIASGKTLKTNTNVGLIATRGGGLSNSTSVAENKGNLISTRTDKGIGIYASTSNGKNSGTITMNHDEAVGILGEHGSNLTNSMKIELKEKSSAGIYGKDSNITQETAAEIKVNKGSSAGMYAIVTSTSSLEKKVINKGKIDISGLNEKSSVGIYGNLDSSVTTTSGKLTIDNSGEITIQQNSSVGIYAKNESNQANTQSIVNNSGFIRTDNFSSIGIVGEKSKISNTGSGTKGIEVKFKNSAGILAKNDSEVINSGRISLNSSSALSSSDGLVGISIDNSSTAENDANGEIIVVEDYSTGMLSSGGDITNAGTIDLAKKESVGMYATNANVTNSGAVSKGILIKDDKSVGIYAKLNSSSTADKIVTNSGKIDIDGTSKTSSAGIYSIIENGATKKLSTVNSGNITINQKKSVGIYAKNESIQVNTQSTVTNGGKIEIKEEESAGILAEKSKVTNTATGTNGIIVSAKKSAGIIGKLGSEIINNGIIKTEIATPTAAADGIVGISLNASKATNGSNGTITLDTDYSTGMYGEANSQLINEGNITGTNKEYIVGMAGDSSTVTNKNIITLNGKKATGIFGKNSSTLLNETTGKIITKEEESVGMYSSSSLKATNKGTIITEKKTSAGMLGDKANIENDSSITTKEEMSAGMYVKNGTSKATNKGTVTTEKKTSAGILAEIDEANGGTVSGLNETTGTITVSEETSAGMLGKVKSAVTASTAKLSLTNKKDININTKNSAGIMVVNESTAVGKENVLAENTGTINLTSSSATNEKNIGILADKATGINTGNINVNSKESIGMLGQNVSSITNNKTITLSGEKGIGMLAKDTSSTADNNDTINVNGKESLGMLGEDSGTVKNNKTISVTAEKGVGIFVRDNGAGKGSGTGENTSTGTITLENKEAVGIFSKNNGTSDSAKNSGTINLGKADGSTIKESLIGMFAQAEAGKKANVKNTKDINVNTKKSVGIYAKNDASNITDVDLENTGDININSKESAGVYAPKANISKVGTITLKNSIDSNSSSAVYVSKGGKVANTAGAKINLGTVNQNRVAYYVNGKDSALAGADIGKITGYGVGVYLQGTSGDKATLDKNTSKLDYTLQGTGNGIIGLLLKGETDIQSYTKGIKVGNTVAATSPSDKAKYAIGIYADAQGTAGTPYNIATSIIAGKNGVGIFADKDSNIHYTGNMEIGDGTTAGTGIFITKKIGTGGKVTLDSNTITLKGTKGVVAIASEGTTFNAGNATIELEGSNIQGVGVYAKKGSTVNVDNWTFNNHGNSAEEVRSEEGGAYINANKSLKPRMVLTHVINGETSIASGKTVTSVNDGSITAKENIGLMAEGIKNPTMTWQEGDFEIVNHGTIDFSNSEKSTAMFINSARAQNDGVIKVGKNSTAIYGFYNKDTRKYDGASVNPDPNKLELETTTNSSISLGDSSTGMYLINAEKIENKGGEITSETGATKNVGIYVVNGQDSVAANNKILNMTTATNINLGNGSVGLYSKGQSNTVRNTVTNTGDITVGDKIAGSPAVAMYAENTNLNTNSNVRVGKDGIAFYGKNSTIEAKGSVNFQNKGVLAYLEDSKFISHLTNLGSTQNTMLYLKNSIAQLDGAGTKVDMDIADGYTGAYIEGNSTLTGVKTIKLGQDSTGLFLKDANFTSEAEKIIGTKDKSRGILATNSNLINKSKISLSGAESIGIYSNADSSKSVVNNGELNLSGKQTLGVFLRGGQSFENKANIKIADSANSKNPTIGIYTAEGTSSIKHSSGIIEVGQKSIGIYSKTNSAVEMTGGKIHVKDQGIGIYKEAGKLTIKGELDVDKHVATVKDSEPTAVYGVNGVEVTDKASKISIGEKSYGFILSNTDDNKINTFTNTNTGTVKMADESTYLYSSGKAKITNNRNLSSNGANRLISFYIKEKGEFTNNGIIDFSNGKGNLGIYAPGGKATNKGTILVGKTDDIDPITGKIYTDLNKIVYGIGMAADNTGKISNEGEIRVSENKSIGMYGSGLGTIVENTESGKIYLDGSKATDSNKIESMTGVYVDNGATFTNKGLITTIDSYAGRDEKVNENVNGLVGVAVMNGSTLINEAGGKILIDAGNSYGVIIRGKRDASGNVERYAVIKNYGEIKVRGKGTWGISWRDVKPEEIAALEAQINKKITSDPPNQEIRQAAGTDKELEGIKITVVNGKPIFSRNGIEIPEAEVEQIGKLIGKESNLGLSDIGFYVDTLGKTKPIDLDGGTPPIDSQLIIGTEYSEMTNAKQWHVKEGVIKPFLEQIQGRNFKLKSLAGSLTWMATPILNANEEITGIAMAKIPYTSFVKQTDNAYNFTDGLEQRYDMNELNSPEKRIFNLLNGIGKNEEVLLTQAYDEMMGHQYANVQQRIQVTGNILDNEFKYLKREWSNPSKDSNKIKVFGTRGEYNTGTASVIDYKNHAEGVAYLHEKETFQLGNSTGWYTGFIHNQFKFKDIGKSREEMYQTKLGMFKSMAFDHNNSLHWTISGEMFLGRSKMNRRYLVVDEIFHAKSKYWSYGFAINNEVSKSFRTGESTFIKPYGELKLEYGRFQKIKEKDGEIRLEVKENDYYSVKPKIGVEAGYLHQFGNGISFKTSFGVSYENELGQVADTKNKARVAYTNADYFALPGEKEDRRGNLRTDLNLGLNNEAYGVTANIGYDTKGNKVRGGLGVRVIF